MKKFITSSVVVVGFVAYSLYQRAFGTVQQPASKTTIATIQPTIAKQGGEREFEPSEREDEESTLSQIQPVAMPTSAPVLAQTATAAKYKDGSYTGDAADAFYGLIQVKATVSGGRLVKVDFLQAPNDRGQSVEINAYADPILAQEAINAQSAQVDIVSGATDSSHAFIQSLQSALDKAKK